MAQWLAASCLYSWWPAGCRRCWRTCWGWRQCGSQSFSPAPQSPGSRSGSKNGDRIAQWGDWREQLCFNQYFERCGPVMYLVVIACTEQDAAGGGMPLDQTHSAAVAIKLHHCLCHVPSQTTVWDLPHPNLCSYIFSQNTPEACRPHNFPVVIIFQSPSASKPESWRSLSSKIAPDINVVHQTGIRPDYTSG